MPPPRENNNTGLIWYPANLNWLHSQLWCSLLFWNFLSSSFLEFCLLSFCLFSGVGKRKRSIPLLNMNSFHQFFICLVIFKLVPLCYFQRTNTYFPVVTGEVAWLLWGWGIGSFVTSCIVLQEISVFSSLASLPPTLEPFKGSEGQGSLLLFASPSVGMNVVFLFLVIWDNFQMGEQSEMFSVLSAVVYCFFRGPRS